MRKIILGILLLALALLPGYAAGETETEGTGLQKDIVILYTCDVHCGIDRNWGYAGLYAVKEYYEKSSYVILADGGDAIQGEPIGTITRGEALIDIMNAVGYDIAIPGNHAFDYGMERFLELTGKAAFPYISCNFTREGETVFSPWKIMEFDGVRIAFIGVTTPTTIRGSKPRYFMNERKEYIYSFLQDETGEAMQQAVQQSVDEVRAAGADYVIVLAHLGNETECIPWRYNDLIENTTGIDVVLDGHSHDFDTVVMANKEGRDVLRIATGTKLEAIGVLTIGKDGGIQPDLLRWNYPADAPEMLGLQNKGADAVREAVGDMNETLDQVIAETTVDLIDRDPAAIDASTGKNVRIIRQTETNLGDMCADAYRAVSGAEIAFVGGGGIRAGFRKGQITVRDILTTHPYGNVLTTIQVSGKQILDALEWSVHELPEEFGGFQQVSGLTFTYDPGVPSPVIMDENRMFKAIDETKERRVKTVLVGGEPLDPERIYTLASHEYLLLDEGDGYTMFSGCTEIPTEETIPDTQVLTLFITEHLGGTVGEEYADPYGQGRIISLQENKEER